MDISIIIPAKDEEACIEPLAREILEAMTPLSNTWECIWIDDGSSDDTLAILERLAQSDDHFHFISFKRNAGQSAALHAGFKYSRGRIIATLDADGQNDPKDIPDLIQVLESQAVDMVNGYRHQRRDSWIRKVSSKIANTFRNLTTGQVVRDVGCSTRAFRRDCVEGLPLFKGLHRFLPTLVALQGFRMAEVPVHHRPRQHGRTKYTINNRLWVGLYDIFGVMWLQKRAFTYAVKNRSNQ